MFSLQTCLHRSRISDYNYHPHPPPPPPTPPTNPTHTFSFEYLVKWKAKAYLHCEWLSPSMILADAPPSGKRKIQSFYKHQQNTHTGVPFLPSRPPPPARLSMPFGFTLFSLCFWPNVTADDDALEPGVYFDPLYLEVERIIGASKDQMLSREQRERRRWVDGCSAILSKLINYRYFYLSSFTMWR
jgi:hypothetical protein